MQIKYTYHNYNGVICLYENRKYNIIEMNNFKNLFVLLLNKYYNY